MADNDDDDEILVDSMAQDVSVTALNRLENYRKMNKRFFMTKIRSNGGKININTQPSQY